MFHPSHATESEASTSKIGFNPAETIQDQAIAPHPVDHELNKSVVLASSDDPKLLQRAIETYCAAGWRLVAQNDSAVQFQKPKHWSGGSEAIFVVLPLVLSLFWRPAVWGAIAGLLVVVIRYVMQKEDVAMVTAEQLRVAIANNDKTAGTPLAWDVVEPNATRRPWWFDRRRRAVRPSSAPTRL
jgi:hypothetical protein